MKRKKAEVANEKLQNLERLEKDLSTPNVVGGPVESDDGED
jgi:hypothetical protein